MTSSIRTIKRMNDKTDENTDLTNQQGDRDLTSKEENYLLNGPAEEMISRGTQTLPI